MSIMLDLQPNINTLPLMRQAAHGSGESSASPLANLKGPAREGDDLVIVGGGPSGLSAAMRLVENIASERNAHGQRPNHIPRFGGLSRVSFLIGGKSLAFSPVEGEFGAYLTLSGSDSARRDESLQRCRDYAEGRFKSLGFDFRKNCAAQKVTVTPDNRFRIRVHGPNEDSFIETKKLILALGHTLKQRPQELREHILSGTNDLCCRLTRELKSSSNHQECLDRLMSGYTRMADGTIRIALVGLGSTFLEVIRIFHALLDPPNGPRDLYLTRRSRTPIEFVLYAPQLTGDTPPTEQMLNKVGIFHSYITGASKPDTFLNVIHDVESYKAAELHRLEEFVRTKQLQVTTQRFNWDSIRRSDGGIFVQSANGAFEEFSCILDCSPFAVGIDEKQKEVIDHISALRFTPTDHGTWMTDLKDETFSNRLAIIGSAFIEKDRWGLGTMNEHATTALKALFPPPQTENTP